jgi:HK97 family phage portal protein
VKIFGWEITRRRPPDTSVEKASGMDLVTHVPPTSSLGFFSGVWRSITEPFTGAWQRGYIAPGADALTFGTVYACVTLIAGDIGKLPLRLIELKDGVWQPTTNPAYSPLLRKPNHYQNRIKFVEGWILSKLIWGNTYVLKARDNRGVVNALYVLDPARVQVLVADDGQVYYQLSTDNLAGIEEGSVTVPASEIIHDLMNALYHPLVGIPPTYACGLAAMQGLKIQRQSTDFFARGSQIGGVLSTTGSISNDVAERLRKHWEENYGGELNAGKVAVLGDGLKFEPMPLMTAVNAQLIEQLKWTGENVCACYHVPPHMVGVAPPPPYGNVQAINIQYYAQCLQNLIESLELALDEGIGLADDLGVQFEIDALLRMDTATAFETASKGVIGGILSPNEARAQFDRPPVKGGDTPYLQQQNYSLEALAKRDEMAAQHPNVPELSPPKPTPAPTPAPAPPPEPKVVVVPAQGLDPLIVQSLATAIDKLAHATTVRGGEAPAAADVPDLATEFSALLKACLSKKAA